MKVQIKTIICSVLALMLCLGICSVPVQAKENEKVRIGICTEEREGDADEYEGRAAYDYEYLMKAAKYAGWDCEVVEGSWQECIAGIERGEIDVMGSIDMIDGHEYTIGYAECPSVYVEHCLLIGEDSDCYDYEDFASFDRMKVGILKDVSSECVLSDYSKENGFHYTPKYYSTDEDLRSALEMQEIDCVYLNGFCNLEGYKRIAEVGNTPYYFAVNKKRSNLKNDLEQALRGICADEYYYGRNLYEKYFTATVQDAFTREERQYLKKNSVVRVFVVDGFPLICEYDAGTHQYKGIIIDVLKKLSDKTGIDFVYSEMPEEGLPGDYLQKHPNTIMAPLFLNSLVPYNGGIQSLETIMPGKMMGVIRTDGKRDFEQRFTIAIPEDMYGAEEKIKKIYPKAVVVSCESHQDGLDYVVRGKADITLVNEIIGAYMLQSPYYENLMQFHMNEFAEDISLGTAPDSDPVFVSLLNKAIVSLGERDIREIFVANTAAISYDVSLGEWIYQNSSLIVLFWIIIVGVIVVMWWRRQSRKEERETKEQLRLVRERLEIERRYQEEIFYQAKHDALTGLYNYEYFCEKSRNMINDKPNAEYAFLYINVEQFKMINEVYGRYYGDIALKKVADVIREKVGNEGVYGRSYSDHFAVCYPVEKNTTDIRQMDKVLCEECDGHEIRIQVSIGIYVNADPDRDVSRCMECAQIALQNGRVSGNGYVHYYQKKYMENLRRSQKITNEMENALAQGQFMIFLQPQFDQIEGTLVGAEALVRWNHPEEGMVSPGQFLPVFEKNGFIRKLDAFVCEEACRLLAKWKKQGIMIPISVNLTRSDLLDENTLPVLKALLEKYEIPVEYLHLEITESAYEKNQEEILRIVELFKENGFIIEMDDFGSSYSSLNMLKDIPIDIIKMDVKFFEGESRRNKGGTIVEAVVKLAHSLGVPVIAEGVETEQDAEFLRRIGCHLVQGYLYGRPTEVGKFEKLMADRTIGVKQISYE